MRPVAAELFTRANYGLPLGNFELDMDDGEIRFKTSLDYSGTTLELPIIASLVETAVGSLATYHTALVRTLYDGVPPKNAIADSES